MNLVHIFFAAAALHWTPQPSHTIAGLRGLAVISDKVAWASGAQGTILRTLDGGEHWQPRIVGGAGHLDFRDIEAFDAEIALVMSSGPADASRVYRTTDGGVHWTLVLANRDQNGFFDAFKFWDRRHGILLGDPIAGHFTIYTTENGGSTWSHGTQPPAIAGEGAFAASGTCLAVLASHAAWFGTGGTGVARVFHTGNRGKNWTVAATPLAARAPTAGIFSVLFINSHRGIAVGGDYQQQAETARTVAVTTDRGNNWVTPPAHWPAGFRSAVVYVKSLKILIAVGTSGSDTSSDGGATWKPLSRDSLNAIAGNGQQVWAVGPRGLILKLALK